MIARRKIVAAFVVAGLAALPSAASAATHTVCPSGCDFPTIQGAVNAAGNGDTINVGVGTYSEAVTVNKSLVLNGPKAGVDGRDPSRTGLPATEAVVTGVGDAGNTPFNVTANNVTIDGFTIEGATNANVFGSNILMGAGTSGETLQNNIIQNGIVGVQLGSSSSTIRRNLFQNNNQPGPVSGTAIYTDQFVAGGGLTNVTIDSNSFGNNTNAGILLSSTDATKQDSAFTISNNSFTTNGNGLLATMFTNSTFTGNVVAGSVGSQVVLGDGVANVAVSNNVIRDGSTNGLRILTFIGGASPTAVTFTCNSVTGNASSGVSLTAGQYSGTLNAQYNWWGSRTGPTIAANPGGTGQSILDPDGDVRFSPFLIDGTNSDPSKPGFQCEPLVAISDVTHSEATSFRFMVTLDNPSPSPVTVGYATQDGTARAGVDYRATSGTLTFAAGELTKSVSVPVLEDGASNEANQSFDLKLLSPSGAILSRNAGVGRITDDGDLVAPSVTHVSEANKIWRDGSKLATFSRAKHKRQPPVGTSFKFTLNTAATVTFHFTRSVRGRQVSRKCVPATKHNRHRHGCTRAVNAGTLSVGAHAGTHTLRFQGRLKHSKKFAPGHYTLVIAATNASGHSRPVSIGFTIVKG